MNSGSSKSHRGAEGPASSQLQAGFHRLAAELHGPCLALRWLESQMGREGLSDSERSRIQCSYRNVRRQIRCRALVLVGTLL